MDDEANGNASSTDIERVNAALVPHGPTARTLIFPVAYVEEKLNVILVLVELPVAPVGKVH